MNVLDDSPVFQIFSRRLEYSDLIKLERSLANNTETQAYMQKLKAINKSKTSNGIYLADY
jgi:hypothetical protein